MNIDKAITIIQYNESYKSTWDSFVDLSKNATFLFKRDFMEYHKDRFADYSLLFFLEDELVAILPATIKGASVFSHQGLTYGGLLVKLTVRFALYKQLFAHLIAFLKERSITDLFIKTIPSIYSESANDELMFLQQSYQCSIEHNIGSVIYSNESLTISKSILRNANKAKRLGIEIKKSNDFDFFWNELLVPRLNNKFGKKPIHSLEEIIKLKALFPNEIELIGAFLNNEMIAGTILFQNKKYTKSQYIAGNPSFNKLGGLDLLHLEIIHQLNKPYFDFGTSSSDETFIEKESLLAWKEQFGARTIVFSTYHFKI